ncbi:ATP-dependent helicase HrpB [Jatrophihabitans telluris]|uniref:ATP-dependent helicase HrpB n=1 Tax=Jatrophihabitans telluris TaxID=2038343 RepID=A0ABY4QRX0_9ACTN|nr:ATP-dependent helicase HrpB [Jatrophihabitans telluris]UQX86629.1 ATP-dependent helicase HrpB [Jatrophihabitans telluris]
MTALLPQPGRPGGDLPVASVLPAVVQALVEHRAAVLLAPPGTGKTTLLPLALADGLEAGGGRVLVAEPRRIATRAAAARMAALIGEDVGNRVGYSVRGERRLGPNTRIEVVTTGLLVQRLLHDQELAGVGAVIIDECHERQLDTDLALAFVRDVAANLRDDLAVVATSATAAAEPIAALLGSALRPAPVITASAALFPVTLHWATRATVPFDRNRRVSAAMLDEVAATVRRAADEADGDLLVFLPGESEIVAVTQRLRHAGIGELMPLLGRQSAAEQQRALRAGPGRRVVLSTAVAESSVTVDGVRIVVDAGLSRQPQLDHERGLGSLVTVRVSRASAEQRAGRAGRQGPGRVYRLWTEVEHSHLDPYSAPELQTADLTAFALNLAVWGTSAGAGLELLERPGDSALDGAVATLRLVGAVDHDGRVTDRGSALARVGVHPRLARALLDGSSLVGPDMARELVALLGSDRLLSWARRGDDLTALWRRLRAGSDPAATADWRAEIARLARTGREVGTDTTSVGALNQDRAAATVIGLAYPERLARRRPTGGDSYLLASGTGASLAADTQLRDAPWLAVAVADRPSGRRDADVRLAAVLQEDLAVQLGVELLSEQDTVEWARGELVAAHITRLGAIELSRRPLADADPADLLAAIRTGLRDEGLDLLGWTATSRNLRQRLAFCHRQLVEQGWPDVSDGALLARLDSWLGPELARVRRRADLGRTDPGPGLSRLVGWPLFGRLGELAPERLTVPSGSRLALDYADLDRPRLSVRLQETFGWTRTPRLAEGRVGVVIELLSPAGRPVAVTADLASFWAEGYRAVRSELRGRYPKHAWPEDPSSVAPLRGLPRRGAQSGNAD